MSNTSKIYDLEERTFRFAKDVRAFVKKVPQTILTANDCDQLIRSSGSIGANYIEANGALGKKDFLMRIKSSRKEAGESAFWLGLLLNNVPQSLFQENERLLKEAQELELIFGAILRNSR